MPLTLINIPGYNIIKCSLLRYLFIHLSNPHKTAIMNTIASKKIIDLNRLFFSLLNKLMQRPDFYPIKYYHKKRRGRTELESL